MSIEITVPRLGWSMEEAIFTAWLKRDGERVQAGEPLFTLESDKATQDVESLDSGILRLAADSPRGGETVRVGQRIALLVGDTEEPGKLPTVPSASMPAPNKERTAADVSNPPKEPISMRRDPARVAEIRSTPRARRVADELGMRMDGIVGTGRDGRIRERDVRDQVERNKRNPGRWRQAIAEHLSESNRQTVPVTLHTNADASAIVRWREKLKQRASGSESHIPSYTDLMVQLTASALKSHPVLNARWNGADLQVSVEIHVGIAVDTVQGLIVPVVRDAGRLSLEEISRHSSRLIEQARSGKLAPADLHGGTFTITNLGSLGVDGFSPVIHYPECAILGLGRIVRQPVCVEDRIEVQDRITLSLTFDHRATDGAPAARFLQTLVGLIESWTGGE